MNEKLHPERGNQVIEPVHERTTIDSTFRNGTLTAVGVVVGFSLGFLSRWAGLPGEWAPSDLVAMAAITIGILLQIRALASLLSIHSLLIVRYNRAVRIFIVGLILVVFGVAIAIFADLTGYGGIALKS